MALGARKIDRANFTSRDLGHSRVGTDHEAGTFVSHFE